MFVRRRRYVFESLHIAVIERQIHAFYGHVGVGHSGTLYNNTSDIF